MRISTKEFLDLKDRPIDFEQVDPDTINELTAGRDYDEVFTADHDNRSVLYTEIQDAYDTGRLQPDTVLDLYSTNTQFYAIISSL